MFTWEDMALIFHKVQMTCGHMQSYFIKQYHVISYDFTAAVTHDDASFDHVSVGLDILNNL